MAKGIYMAIGSDLKNQIWKAVRQLNPAETLREAERPIHLAVVGRSRDDSERIVARLLGEGVSQDGEVRGLTISTYSDPLDEERRACLRRADIVLAMEGTLSGVSILEDRLVILPEEKLCCPMDAILASQVGKNWRLAIGRHMPLCREGIARGIVQEVAKENAIFVVATGLGDVVPSWLLPIVGLAEAASDTAFLTGNQVRMIFNIGAVCGIEVGYVAQWKEIASIVGAAFGWRALARELVSKIPFGGGLIPKGAIAYSGTAAAGEAAIFYYTTGRRMTHGEVSQAFRETYSRALDFARSVPDKFKK